MEQENTSIHDRIKREKERILELLAESGNVSYACKKVGIARKTFYRWKEEDVEFSDEADVAISSGKSFVNDLAHTQLVRSIQEGDFRAVRFQLVSCHPDYRRVIVAENESLNRKQFTPLITLENMRQEIQKKLNES